MLAQLDLIGLFNAVETNRHDQAPFPIVAPITTERLGQSRVYRVPVKVPDLYGTPETLIVVVRPIHAPNEYPGALLGQPITTASPVLFNLVAVQQGQDAADAVAPAPAPANPEEPAVAVSAPEPASVTPAEAA